MQLQVGADPELFLRDGEKFVSAYGMVKGTKVKPQPVKNGAVQVDGMALEFNIDPATSAKDFVNNIDTVMQQLREMIPGELDFSLEATATFDEDYMKAQPEEALALGCDPDFDAYSRSVNPPPEAHPTMRVAGGHVHFGWTKDQDVYDQAHFNACCDLAIQMDYYLGLLGTIFDEDDHRRQMYGRPGAFRPKPYGMEYRVLSNFWLNSQRHMLNVYHNARIGFNKLIDDNVKIDEYCQKSFDMRAKDIIEKDDRDRAIYVAQRIGMALR